MPISPTLEVNQTETEDPEKDEEKSMKGGEGLSQDGETGEVEGRKVVGRKGWKGCGVRTFAGRVVPQNPATDLLPHPPASFTLTCLLSHPALPQTRWLHTTGHCDPKSSTVLKK